LVGSTSSDLEEEMSVSAVLRPEAQQELAEAFEWYEAQVAGLDECFLESVDFRWLFDCKATGGR
jgi:hypothetical protein